MSLVQFAVAVFVEPRYLKLSTCSTFSPSIMMLHSSFVPSATRSRRRVVYYLLETSFCLVLAIYLCLVHCDFYHLLLILCYCCWSFGFVLVVFTCNWCAVISITCQSALVACFCFGPCNFLWSFGIVAYLHLTFVTSSPCLY